MEDEMRKSKKPFICSIQIFTSEFLILGDQRTLRKTTGNFRLDFQGEILPCCDHSVPWRLIVKEKNNSFNLFTLK